VLAELQHLLRRRALVELLVVVGTALAALYFLEQVAQSLVIQPLTTPQHYPSSIEGDAGFTIAGRFFDWGRPLGGALVLALTLLIGAWLLRRSRGEDHPE
jgi:hypothetical protein